MEINYALIGKRIRETRKQRGLSAEELAEIADLSTVYISYIENAKRKPSLESLIKISNALEITIDELLYGNLLYNPTEYQTDIDLLMADCTSTEKRYIFEVLSAIKKQFYESMIGIYPQNTITMLITRMIIKSFNNNQISIST